ncbi:hypothetical protein H6P81_012185 [Aristolochia fimbriata]|uniref:Enoyl reductase (ER) domain-containing protein n=1 Tax=Aristolochia fimbriata TaxID=158543 RepID=A0AAV7EEB9_ARIFI|nr:hypothetical protein H6P81_012185 [Aristolochia fimbriata]
MSSAGAWEKEEEREGESKKERDLQWYVEVPVPSPKKDEVLLKVEALNPAERHIQKGMLRPLLPRRFPFIPGGLAEFAVSSVRLTVKRPTEISASHAAGLNIAGLTALQALTEVAGVKLDGSGNTRNILITAASGGVGHYAVQLAKLVMDYKTPEGAALRSPSGRKYDAVIHCASATPWSIFEPNLSEYGQVIELSPNASAMWTSAVKRLTLSKKKLVPLLMKPKGENLELLVRLVKEGKLKTVVDSTSTLSNAKEAWNKIMDGHATGKIIVEP